MTAKKKKALSQKAKTATKKETAARRSPKKTVARRSPKKTAARSARVTAMRARDIDALRDEIDAQRAELVPRWNAKPDDVRRSVAQLVLALVEFVRRLLERQAIRRMEDETLTSEEVERIGIALMRLEETVVDLAGQFDLAPEDLNLDLGPLGRLS